MNDFNSNSNVMELNNAMKERTQSDYYQTVANSDMVKTINSFRGIKSNFFFTSSGSTNISSNPSDSVIVNPENLFDGQANSEASVSMTSSGSWNVMVCDYSSNWLQGTLNVSGEYYIGTIASSSLSQGNYFIQDGDFNSLAKSGYYHSTDSSIVRNNVVVRSANLDINGTVLMRVYSDGGVYYFTVGLNMNRMRNILITTQPEKIFFAVKNGTFEFVKTPPVLSISIPTYQTSIIDIDALDVNKRVGIKWKQQNNNYTLTTNTQVGSFGYGLVDDGDIIFDSQPSILSVQRPLYGYIFAGDEYPSNVYASKNGDGSLPIISSSIYNPGNNRRYMWAYYDSTSLRYMLILGVGNNFQHYGACNLRANTLPIYYDFSAVAYASANSFYSFTVNNVNTDVTSLSLTAGVWPKHDVSEHINLYKIFGSLTAYYFRALKRPLLTYLNEEVMMIFYVNTETTVYFGLGTGTSDEPSSVNGTPTNIRFQITVNGDGTVLRDGVSVASLPQTPLMGNFYTIYFSISIPESSETASINIGRSKSQVSSPLSLTMPYGVGVVPTIWTSGGNNTQTFMCSVKGYNGKAYFTI